MMQPAKKKRAKAAVKLPAELTQARRFGKTRSAQSGALLEDYVELIDDLLSTNGEARPTDVARRLGVSHATAIKTIARLKREGLATGRPYRGVFLTEEGQKLAARVRTRHRLVVDILLGLGRARRSRGSRCRGHRALCLGGDAKGLRAIPAVARSRSGVNTGRASCSRRRSIEAELHQVPERLNAIFPVDLFAFGAGAAVIGDGDFVDTLFVLAGDAGADFNIDAKTLVREAQRIGDFTRHHLVAGLNIAELLVEDHAEQK